MGAADKVADRLREKLGGGYEWRASEDASFFPGRQAGVYLKDKLIGQFGVVHPKVLENFDIQYPVSALEIDIEPFCFNLNYQALQTHYSLGL